MTASTEVFNTLVAETYSYLEKEQSRIAQAKSLVQAAANAEVCFRPDAPIWIAAIQTHAGSIQSLMITLDLPPP
jgi:hypothetical protein